MSQFEYVVGDQNLFEEIRALWLELGKHHAEISPHFKKDFQTFTFEERMASLNGKTKDGFLRIEYVKNENQTIAYCISSVDSKKTGEVDSLFVKNEFRNKGIAAKLMTHALEWLEGHEVKKKIIGVASGNEEVLALYEKFGFHPRVLILQQVK